MTHEGRDEFGKAEAAAEQDLDDNPAEPSLLESKVRPYHWFVVGERVVAVALLTALFVTVLLQVFTRYVLSAPLTWTEEVARYLLIWTTFVAAAYVSARRLHISVDLLITKLNRAGAVAVSVIASAIVLLISTALVIGAGRAAYNLAHVTSPATNTPMWLVYASAVVGFGLIGFHSILDIYMDIRHWEAMPKAMEGIEKGSAF